MAWIRSEERAGSAYRIIHTSPRLGHVSVGQAKASALALQLGDIRRGPQCLIAREQLGVSVFVFWQIGANVAELSRPFDETSLAPCALLVSYSLTAKAIDFLVRPHKRACRIAPLDRGLSATCGQSNERAHGTPRRNIPAYCGNCWASCGQSCGLKARDGGSNRPGGNTNTQDA